jgi:hypothetical protein
MCTFLHGSLMSYLPAKLLHRTDAHFVYRHFIVTSSTRVHAIVDVNEETQSHRGGPGSRPGLVKWVLWWTKWRWGRISPSTSVYPANLHFTKFSIFTVTRGRYNRPQVAESGLHPPQCQLKKRTEMFALNGRMMSDSASVFRRKINTLVWTENYFTKQKNHIFG